MTAQADASATAKRPRARPVSVPQPKRSSVQKACRILRAMTDRRLTRLTEIAQAAGLDKATALRLLELLHAEGFVSRDLETKRYAYGSELFALSAALQDRTDLRALARPSLLRLAGAFGDTAILFIPSGFESVCVDMQFGKYPLRANYLDIGTRRPLGVNAGSLALLAAMPDAEIAAMMPIIAKRLDRYPRITPRLIERHIAAAREKGYVLMLDLVVDRMGAIAVPILAADRRPVGALSVAGLTERIATREDALARALRREATLVSSLCSRITEPEGAPHAAASRAGSTRGGRG